MIAFYIPGNPATKGDHAAAIVAGHAVLRERDAGRKASWRELAKIQARAALADRRLFDLPVCVEMVVHRLRPKCHYGTGRNAGVLKASAPRWPGTAPDLDKLARSIGDALNGVLWRDDALISTWVIRRRWADAEGISIAVYDERDVLVTLEPREALK